MHGFDAVRAALTHASVYKTQPLRKPGFTRHIALHSTQTSVDATQPLRKAVFTNLTTPPHALATSPHHSYAECVRGDRTWFTRQFLHTTALTYNKCHASSNRCLTGSNKKLLETSASLLVTSATLVVLTSLHDTTRCSNHSSLT